MCVCMYVYIYIYIYIYTYKGILEVGEEPVLAALVSKDSRLAPQSLRLRASSRMSLRPISLLALSLLALRESNFPGDPCGTFIVEPCAGLS